MEPPNPREQNNFNIEIDIQTGVQTKRITCKEKIFKKQQI